MYFAGKLVYLIVLASVQLAVSNMCGILFSSLVLTTVDILA